MISAGPVKQAQNAVDLQHPYPGLRAFGEGDSTFFFGRDAEQHELFRMVKRTVLTTCFGASGLGKTSLLSAGLFPKLRAAQFFPMPIRLDFAPAGASLVRQVKHRIIEEVAAQHVDAPEPDDEETLWEYFHRAHFWDERSRLLMPVLVFDQFEEVFTLGASDPRVKSFWEEAADLIENRIPIARHDRFVAADESAPFSLDSQHYRLLFSLREDYLPHLEDFQQLIPSLGQSRFRLTAMDGAQALDAILQPGKEIITEDVALEILRITCGRAAPKGVQDLRAVLRDLRIEPTLLSLFCHEFNDRRMKRGMTQITLSLLKGSSDQIVSDFYERCFQDRKSAVRDFVEKQLLTGSGFRRAEAVEEAIRLPGVTVADIDELVNRRLLRTETRLGIPHVELTHDVLTGVVADSRNRRLQNQARRKLWWRIGVVAAVCLAIIVLLAYQAKTSADAARKSALLEEEAQTARTQLRTKLAELADLAQVTTNVGAAASPDLEKLRQQANEAVQQDVCAKYSLCAYNNRESWRNAFLREAKTGTWQVLVLSLQSSNRRNAEEQKKMFQKRFPNQDFEVLDTINADGGNSQYAVVIAQGLDDPRIADQIVGFAREAGIEKNAFKRQRR